MAFNPNDDDSLGIGLQARAADRRMLKRNTDMQTMSPGEWNNRNIGGPAVDPQWDGFFQALHEQGVSGVADDSVGMDKGMWSRPPNQGDDDTRRLASMDALLKTIDAARGAGKLGAS